MTYDLAGTELNFLHRRIIGAAKSFITSGLSPTAAISGFLGGGGGGRRPMRDVAPARAVRFRGEPVLSRRAAVAARTVTPITAPRPVTRLREARITGTPTAAQRPVTRLADAAPRPGDGESRRRTPCGIGFVLENGVCVRRGRDLLDPLGLFGPSKPARERMPARRGVGRAVEGAFGLPAFEPEEEMVPTLRCPRGMVLGQDDLCYPKAVLPRRSQWRKWRGQARPPVSAGDARAIRKANAARERVLKLAKNVGLHASKTKPKSAAKAPSHQHLLAPPTLRVISEESN